MSKKFTRTLTITNVKFVEVQEQEGGLKANEEQSLTLIGEVEPKAVKRQLEDKFGVEKLFLIKDIEVKEQKYSVDVEEFLKIATAIEDKEETPAEETEQLA